MSQAKLRTIGLLCLTLQAPGQLLANDISVGAYAVANHSSCSAGNIPGTILELNKFFASPHFANRFKKNFYWKDARVRNSDWTKDGDFKSSSETEVGFDGSDASVLTYIASHGVTSSGIYKALAGSRSNGGCYIPTPNLELGNHASRYTILSTCQGLKIGNGDFPNSPGENPSKTWKDAAKGLNCIFGYSNNMADADEYGELLLENMKDDTTPIAKAFMDASDAVDQSNVPAVLCFGATEEEAASYIASNKTFENTSRPNTASAWVYRKSSERVSVKDNAPQIPAALRLSPTKLNLEKIATTFLGNSVKKSRASGLQKYEAPSGELAYDEKSGTITVKNNLVEEARNIEVPSVAESEQIATHALKLSGIAKDAGDLTLASVTEDVLGGESGIKSVLSRRFTFRQKLAGGFTLSQQGTVDVSVGPGGAITEIKSAILDVNSQFKAAQRPTNLSSRLEDLEIRAIESVTAKVPGANYRVIGHRIGYDAGHFHKRKSFAPGLIELTVEANFGEFSRRYIERFAL